MKMTAKRKKIIVVDDNTTNLVACKNILKPFYEVYPAYSAVKLFELLEWVSPNLIMLDVEMPDMDGYETARLLKSNDAFRDIPIIFLTAKRELENELEGLNLGAMDYIYKPFAGPLLLRRIETHLTLIAYKEELKSQNLTMQKMLMLKNGQVWQLQNAVLGIVADLVECRDDVTGGHISRTQKLLSCMLEKLKEKGVYSEETSLWNPDYVLPSAQLHDVGKIGISDAILNKPGKLTPEEFEIMKNHVKIGVDAINHMEKMTDDHSFFQYARAFAGTHHEKWDGNGYPNGLRGMDIPLEGRIMAIVDVYDALVSSRPYKKSFPTQEAAAIIREGKGTHFDPCLVEIFQSVSDQFAGIAHEVYEMPGILPSYAAQSSYVTQPAAVM
ncbi:MAG: response regulator [Syntrophobacterales bacterium]|jgi:putative two-component system response regulator|nr:response regulator [Syntrophobacterales bacterium]